MELWQMDIVGGIVLADGGECKMVTGIDDHSRFMVIAKVVQRATARAASASTTSATPDTRSRPVRARPSRTRWSALASPPRKPRAKHHKGKDHDPTHHNERLTGS